MSIPERARFNVTLLPRKAALFGGNDSEQDGQNSPMEQPPVPPVQVKSPSPGGVCSRPPPGGAVAKANPVVKAVKSALYTMPASHQPVASNGMIAPVTQANIAANIFSEMANVSNTVPFSALQLAMLGPGPSPSLSHLLGQPQLQQHGTSPQPTHHQPTHQSRQFPSLLHPQPQYPPQPVGKQFQQQHQPHVGSTPQPRPPQQLSLPSRDKVLLGSNPPASSTDNNPSATSPSGCSSTDAALLASFENKASVQAQVRALVQAASPQLATLGSAGQTQNITSLGLAAAQVSW
jgi:hypothetical protein